ncbi:MAG: S1 family peptidase [Elusimicrobiaceae bacterium]|nr:S1 family peptidase [Elusimicrobiaceae bacterium]
MRKIFIFIIFCLLTPLVFGVEVFIHVPNQKEGSMCQAVRIKDGWFMTAAHCVPSVCKFSSCKAEIAPGIETTKIYSHSEAQPNNPRYDIAIINFESKELSSFRGPKILIMKNNNFDKPKMLNKRLWIDYSLGAGGGQISSKLPIFYGPKKKIIYTGESGLFHGLSGAGVMTDSGELISVVSAVAGQGANGKFSVFSFFDEKVESFLSRIPGLTFTTLNKNDFTEVDEKANSDVFSLDNN